MPWLMALRVVSLPAADSRMKNDPISDDVRRSPLTSARTRLVVRSSVGRARRSSASATPYSPSPVDGADDVSKSPATSSSPAPRIIDVHRKTFSSSSSGMPIMSQMICSGNGPAIDLHEIAPGRRDALRTMSATSRRARSRTLSSMRASTFGVNARLTIARSRRWRGSSSDDHRTDVFGDLDGHVVERRAGRDGAEDLRMPARVLDVLARGERPVPGTGGNPGELWRPRRT